METGATPVLRRRHLQRVTCNLNPAIGMAAKRHKRHRNKRNLQCSAACFYFTWRVEDSQNAMMGKSSIILSLLRFFAASQLRFSGSTALFRLRTYSAVRFCVSFNTRETPVCAHVRSANDAQGFQKWAG